MTPAARIRKARMNADLSQGAIAERLNVSRSCVSQWERYSGTRPTTSNLAKLATLLKVSSEWLTTGRGSMKLGDTHEEPAAHMAEFAFDELESRLLAGFRQLTGRKKNAVVELIEKIRN